MICKILMGSPPITAMGDGAEPGGQGAPVMVFDNLCYLCIKFAGVIRLLAGDRIAIVGHYSDQGRAIRDEILDESALKMFWLVSGQKAYGGRAALVPLVRSILFSRGAASSHKGGVDGSSSNDSSSSNGSCSDGGSNNGSDCRSNNNNNGDGDGDGTPDQIRCKTPRAVFLRSSSLLTNSRVIDIPVKSK